MTKDELVKEAKQSYLNTTEETQWSEEGELEYTRGYQYGAEPREKQIAELTEQNTSLLTSVENLNKSVQELEAQIEKMKCCENCKNRKWDNEYKEFICGYVCKNREDWELRR